MNNWMKAPLFVLGTAAVVSGLAFSLYHLPNWVGVAFGASMLLLLVIAGVKADLDLADSYERELKEEDHEE